MKTDSYRVLDVHVSALDPDSARDLIASMVADRQKGYVCVAPVATIVDARKDPMYRQVIDQAAMVTPDGAPVAWLGRLAGFSHVRRTYGPDLMLALCEAGQARGWRHFFYGSTSDVCDKLVARLKQMFPKMVVAGAISPSYSPQAQMLADDVSATINAARPDIIWVGLGSPKQDFWMSLNREVLEAPVMVGIGAAFDFHAGVKPQAPRWMGRCGLEWLFRLCCEPRRLWRRYLIGNMQFLFWLLIDHFHPRGGERS